MAALVRVQQHWPDAYELRDTAGVNQVYRQPDAPAPLDILRRYYGGPA